jgi:hypothetical protein
MLEVRDWNNEALQWKLSKSQLDGSLFSVCRSYEKEFFSLHSIVTTLDQL